METLGTGLVATLFVIGILLLILEIFVPGGILGLFGIITLSIAIMHSVDSFALGFFLICLLLLSFAGLFALSFRLPQTRFIWDRFSLKTCQTQEEGYTAPLQSYEIFLGKHGIALCQLRPAGTADFSGERLDVVTEGVYVTTGSRVKVIAVEGTRVVVRQI